jgi:nitrous oxidase accessory protein NosD
MRTLLILLLNVILTTAAAAKTIKVPGDETNVDAALAVANAGDTIKLAKGAHAGFTVDSKTDLLIKGSGKPLIDGKGGGGPIVTVMNSSGIVIEGLVIAESTGDGIEIRDSIDITVQKCTLRDLGQQGVRAWASSLLLIQKNTIDVGSNGVDFTDDTGGPTNDSLVQKNKFEGGATGVYLGGMGNRVEKNRFNGMTTAGVTMEDTTTTAVISKNKIESTNNGIVLVGSGHLVEKNKIKVTQDDAIQAKGDNCRVVKNKIDGALDDGIFVRGDNNRILANKIKSSADNGIFVAADDSPPSTGNFFEKNKVQKSGTDGFHLSTGVTGNTFIKNKAAKSENFDLLSAPLETDNTFDGNKFGTTSFP